MLSTCFNPHLQLQGYRSKVQSASWQRTLTLELTREYKAGKWLELIGYEALPPPGHALVIRVDVLICSVFVLVAVFICLWVLSGSLTSSEYNVCNERLVYSNCLGRDFHVTYNEAYTDHK